VPSFEALHLAVCERLPRNAMIGRAGPTWDRHGRRSFRHDYLLMNASLADTGGQRSGMQTALEGNLRSGVALMSID
jgi:hypothetical protein